MTLLESWRNFTEWLRPRLPGRSYMHAGASDWETFVRPGDLCIDCGANVGDATAQLRSLGAEVIAFEPNPHAFKVLAERFQMDGGVDRRQAAAWTQEGKMNLLLHARAEEDQVKWSTGSSLLAEKSNVNRETSVEVPTVDLAAFLQGLPRPVRMVKMDIEGAEVAVLNHLLDTGAWRKAERFYVETHERKIPALAEKTRQLRERVEKETDGRFHLNWI